MKRKLAVVLGVVVCCVGVAMWPSASPAAIDQQVVTAASAVMPVCSSDDPPKTEYIGSKKCKMCHSKVHKSWAETKKAKAFELLKPGEAKEAKEKAGLDAAKDYTKDESCLKCHTTGYGKPGGYAIPKADDEKAVKKAKKLEGGGCETCHGAGSAYTKLHKEIKKSKRKYKVEEMYAAGMTKIEKKLCETCHNDKSPTYDKSKPFDFDKAKGAGSHEHIALKQREG